MLNTTRVVIAAAVTAVLSGLLTAGAASGADDPLAKGRELAFDRKKGNCLACHMIADGDLPGNVGPPLIAMKARYPDKAALYDQIWDSTESNPRSTMPPFGKHGILSDEEIELVTEYIYSL
jgi:sulfur-oxidizing protein SoxX